MIFTPSGNSIGKNEYRAEKQNLESFSKLFSEFEKDLKELGITLTDNQIDQFMRYYELLIEWNSFMNLTAVFSVFIFISLVVR